MSDSINIENSVSEVKYQFFLLYNIIQYYCSLWHPEHNWFCNILGLLCTKSSICLAQLLVQLNCKYLVISSVIANSCYWEKFIMCTDVNTVTVHWQKSTSLPPIKETNNGTVLCEGMGGWDKMLMKRTKTILNGLPVHVIKCNKAVYTLWTTTKKCEMWS